MLTAIVTSTICETELCFVSVDSIKKREFLLLGNDIDYDEPNEIDLMLTHRDVYLDFFKDKQKAINRLKSGTELRWHDGYFYVSQNGHYLLVGRISSGMKNKLTAFTEKGYGIEQAHVQFCLYWKGKEDKEETMIFLPELYLTRNGKTGIS